jgi:hypothetical protein
MSKKAVASVMAEVASSSSDESSNILSFPDCLNGTRVSLVIVLDGGKLQSPKELRAQIIRPVELMQAAAWFFAQQLPGMKRHREEPPPPLGYMLTQFSPCVPVRVMCGCVATACRRLATAPAGVYVVYRTTRRCVRLIFEHVLRGRVKKVQVWLQRRACCAVRCAYRASACLRCVFDACCRKLWLVLWCVAAHRSGCMKRAAAFIHVSRLLLPPALQADAAFWSRHGTEMAFRCFAMLLLMLMPWTSETKICKCPPPPFAPHLFSSFSCGKFILLLSFSQYSPLHWSAMLGHLEVCRLLLQCNADIEAKDDL